MYRQCHELARTQLIGLWVSSCSCPARCQRKRCMVARMLSIALELHWLCFNLYSSRSEQLWYSRPCNTAFRELTVSASRFYLVELLAKT